MHEESSSRRKVDDQVHDGAIPAYLLDRDETTRAKVLLCFWVSAYFFGALLNSEQKCMPLYYFTSVNENSLIMYAGT